MANTPLIQPITHWPTVENEPFSDFAMTSINSKTQQQIILVYEVKRDFLSTPRTHAIISFEAKLPAQVKFNQFERAQYFSKRQLTPPQNDTGWFQLLNHHPGSDLKKELPEKSLDTPKRLLLLLDHKLIEIVCEQANHLDTLYYGLSVDSALAEYLAARD